ncbi:amino-acid N-acetyltransferase [Moraxella macacae]|nr:amino-acid N-acetyltransferase [Moraxella macacae]
MLNQLNPTNSINATNNANSANGFNQNGFNQYVQWFRHVAPYINMHRAKTFVIMFDGDAVLHPNFVHLIHDFALLQSLGIRLVLVHGARPQIDDNLALLNICSSETPLYHGVRVTPKNALPAVINAIGAIRLQIESQLSMGLANSPMHGAKIDVVSGNFVTARPYGVRDGVDYQFTGEVRRVDRDAIVHNLTNGHIVLLSAVGYSATGEMFNLLAEDVAVQAAIALQADKLIFLQEALGIYQLNDSQNQAHSLVREINQSQIEPLMENVNGDSKRLLRFSNQACQQGVKRVHVLSYASNGALLAELFSRDGSGTLISQGAYDHIRSARISDIVGLQKLLAPLEQQGILVERSQQRLESELGYFSIIERDGMVIGCGALYPLVADDGSQHQAEIACVAIHSDYRQGSRGADLIAFLEQQAIAQNQDEIFVLTTRTAHWFMELGFGEVEAERLPQSRFASYDVKRKSKVLFKKLV